MVKLRPCQPVFIIVTFAICASLPVFSQKKFVDPQSARDCGCTLRKWPLLSDFLLKTMPAVESLQPETVLPH
ncbi:MAG TPA: hypothetical protein VI750_07335, partial [Pyrinomonadaceae bacterium]|nr:hypothetical protein [Pyrinomonadaceae bacterium]